MSRSQSPGIRPAEIFGYAAMLLLAAMFGTSGPEVVCREGSTEWKPGDPIGYINPKIPEVHLPPYKGEKYEATVPDTLDLAERARIAINALTETTTSG